MSDADRFWARVDKTDGCWFWTGGRSDTGYGLFHRTGGAMVSTHRLSYELTYGPIPKGLHIDHECHNRDESCDLREKCPHRRCVRPDHLAAVTPLVNALSSSRGVAARHKARTHCKNGHEYTPDNINASPSYRGRQCKTCCREAAARSERRKQESRLAAESA